MKDESVTYHERQLAMLMRVWIVLFALAGIGFLIFPDQIVKYLNIIGERALKWSAPPVEPSSERFWLVLTIALMVVLIISSIKAQLDITKYISYVKIIIISKLTSTLGFIIAFLSLKFSFAYLAGAVIDGLILVLTWVFYRRATSSRYNSNI